MRHSRWMPGRNRTWGILVLSAGVLGLATMGVCFTQAAPRHTLDRATIFTPVTLRRQLNRAPDLWLGRPVWLRARAVHVFAWTCQYDVTCVVRRPALADPTVDAVDAYFPLVIPTVPSPWNMLERVPGVGRFVTLTHAIPWGAIALYQVQLRLPPSCTDGSCATALLVGGPVTVRAIPS